MNVKVDKDNGSQVWQEKTCRGNACKCMSFWGNCNIAFELRVQQYQHLCLRVLYLSGFIFLDTN